MAMLGFALHLAGSAYVNFALQAHVLPCQCMFWNTQDTSIWLECHPPKFTYVTV